MKFTVFTPTYNRAHTLDRPFDSLQRQTLRDFEWLVVDDGSDDATASLLDSFVRRASFPVRCYKMEKRSGKHRAHNLAVSEAKGEFFLVLDSDDALLPDTMASMAYHWDQLPDKTSYDGVSGLCCDPSGRVIGDYYPPAATHSTLRERIYVHKIRGEHFGSIRTDVVRRYPFPDIDGFVPEGTVWMEIATHYKEYCVNEIFRIYYPGDDGLSRIRRSYGKKLYFRRTLLRDWHYASQAPLMLLRAAIGAI